MTKAQRAMGAPVRPPGPQHLAKGLILGPKGHITNIRRVRAVGARTGAEEAVCREETVWTKLSGPRTIWPWLVHKKALHQWRHRTATAAEPLGKTRPGDWSRMEVWRTHLQRRFPQVKIHLERAYAKDSSRLTTEWTIEGPLVRVWYGTHAESFRLWNGEILYVGRRLVWDDTALKMILD